LVGLREIERECCECIVHFSFHAKFHQIGCSLVIKYNPVMLSVFLDTISIDFSWPKSIMISLVVLCLGHILHSWIVIIYMCVCVCVCMIRDSLRVSLDTLWFNDSQDLKSFWQHDDHQQLCVSKFLVCGSFVFPLFFQQQQQHHHIIIIILSFVSFWSIFGSKRRDAAARLERGKGS
jgi:hypothetical protein